MAAIYSNGGNRWNILLLKEMRYLHGKKRSG
jgi:hypothetical protein